MKEFVVFLRDFNLCTVILRLVLSLIIGGLIGLERERSRQAAGLRTHILVCMAATMTILVGIYAIKIMDFDTDPLRIGAQVVSGIGFIGAGAIMVRSGRHIRGITTASGLWCTAAIGLALGIGFYEGAIFCVIFVMIVMIFVKKLDLKVKDTYIYFEVMGSTNINEVLHQMKESALDFSVTEVTPPRSGSANNVGVIIKLNNPVNDTRKVNNAICAIENVAFSLPERNTSDTI